MADRDNNLRSLFKLALVQEEIIDQLIEIYIEQHYAILLGEGFSYRKYKIWMSIDMQIAQIRDRISAAG